MIFVLQILAVFSIGYVGAWVLLKLLEWLAGE